MGQNRADQDQPCYNGDGPSARPRQDTGSTVGTYLTEGLSARGRERAEATRADLDELLPRVQKEAINPDVRPVGMSFEDVGTMRLTQGSSVSVTAMVLRADDQAPPEA